jgi:hypothetical protein
VEIREREVKTTLEEEKAYEDLGRVIVPEFEAQIRAIRQASGPPKVEAAAQRVIAVMNRMIAKAKADPVEYLSGATTDLSTVNALADRVGFAVCGGHG